MAPSAWSKAARQQRWRPQPGARRRESKDGAPGLEQGGGQQTWRPRPGVRRWESKDGAPGLEQGGGQQRWRPQPRARRRTKMASSAWRKAEGQRRWRPRSGARRGACLEKAPTSLCPQRAAKQHPLNVCEIRCLPLGRKLRDKKMSLSHTKSGRSDAAQLCW